MRTFLFCALLAITVNAFADDGSYFCQNLDNNKQPAYATVVMAPISLTIAYASSSANQGTSQTVHASASDGQVQYFELRSDVPAGVAHFNRANAVFKSDGTLMTVVVEGPDDNRKTVAVTYRDCQPENN